jgi:hypothetical protein
VFAAAFVRGLVLLARGPARFDPARGFARFDPARQLAIATVFGLALAFPCGRALAEATVIVEVKRADGSSADGVVRLSKGDVKLECKTQNGRCQIAAVPGGTYSVEVVQADKPAGKPKRVMIPPAGEVKLIVAAQ